MYAIIKKFAKIPIANQKKFKVNITKQFPYIQLKIYEQDELNLNDNNVSSSQEIKSDSHEEHEDDKIKEEENNDIDVNQILFLENYLHY